MARNTIHAAIQDDLVEWITRREALRGEARTLGRATISEVRTCLLYTSPSPRD